MVSKAQQMTQKLHAYLRLEDLKLLFQQWQHLLLEVLCTVFKVLLSCTTIIIEVPLHQRLHGTLNDY